MLQTKQPSSRSSSRQTSPTLAGAGVPASNRRNVHSRPPSAGAGTHGVHTRGHMSHNLMSACGAQTEASPSHRRAAPWPPSNQPTGVPQGLTHRRTTRSHSRAMGPSTPQHLLAPEPSALRSRLRSPPPPTAPLRPYVRLRAGGRPASLGAAYVSITRLGRLALRCARLARLR